MAELHNDATIASTDELMSFIHTTLTSTISNTWNSVDGIDTGANTLDLDTGNLFVQFTWDGDSIQISQSTASSSPVSFGGETGDASFDSEVVFPVTVTNAECWIVLNDTATATDRYAYIVVEFNRDGRYIHFGFGNIPAANKYFSWTGGAFKYGAEFNLTSQGDNPISTAHRGPLMDSLHTVTGSSNNLPTMRATGLRGQIVGSKWLAFTLGNPTNVDNTNDGDGDAVSTGRSMVRWGLDPAMASFQQGSANSSLINRIPIKLFFCPRS